MAVLEHRIYLMQNANQELLFVRILCSNDRGNLEAILTLQRVNAFR